jgi:AGZA family xanthine/uracil permease-like MFS transporter
MAFSFQIRQRGSTVGREVIGGLTTFMAMSYILFVQPALLKKTGMDEGGVFMATCLASAVACVLMGLLANYPIALAPGMGENFFFVYTLCGVGAAAGTFKLTWQEAMALTVAVGVVFVLLARFGVRSMLLNAIPDALKSGIAAGIGLFIALIGFEWGNLIKSNPATLVALADLHGNYVAALTLLGLGIMLVLMVFRVRGAILLGILATTAATWAVGRIWGVEAVTYNGLVGMPGGLGATATGFLDGFKSLPGMLVGRHAAQVLTLGFILLFMDMFDTVGTLVAVGSRADLITKDGKLPAAERALTADALGTIAGGCLGTSTVTSYIESITGVAAGARTGLSAIVAGLCLLAALFFQPLVKMIGGGVGVYIPPEPNGYVGHWVDRYPMIAPALIVVGAMMMRAAREIEWDEITESLPAFLAMVGMAFTFSIATGIAIGFISYAFAKLISGKARQCPAIVYVFAVLFVLQYAIGAMK